MKKLLLVGTAVLLMATETAHAQANSYFGPPSGGATVCSAHQYIADDKAHLLNRAQDSWGWVRWELPSEVPSILAEAWFSECRGLLREVGQAQSSGHCSPVRGSNSCQTARRAWASRLLTTAALFLASPCVGPWCLAELSQQPLRFRKGSTKTLPTVL